MNLEFELEKNQTVVLEVYLKVARKLKPLFLNLDWIKHRLTYPFQTNKKESKNFLLMKIKLTDTQIKKAQIKRDRARFSYISGPFKY